MESSGTVPGCSWPALTQARSRSTWLWRGLCRGAVPPGRARPSWAPASALLDQRVDLAELWGECVAVRLAEELAQTDEPEAAANLLDKAVAGRAGPAGPPDPMVDALVGMLRRPPASMGAVHAASTALSVGERRFYRRCCTAVGYGPRPWSGCCASSEPYDWPVKRDRWLCSRPGPGTPTRPI